MNNEFRYDDGPIYDYTESFYNQQKELARQYALEKWNTHDPFVRASKELIEIIEKRKKNDTV